MSKKKRSFIELFFSFLQEIKIILQDIFFAYKHFFHWNISKIWAVLASVCIWLLLALPAIVITLIIAFIDPINWIAVLWQESFLGQLQDIKNVFWSLGVFVFWALSFLLLFLGSGYYLIYILKLSLSYVDRKIMKRKKLFSVSRKSFFCFLRLSCLTFIYIFSPVFLWIVISSIGISMFGIAFEENFIVKMLLSCIYILIVYITYKIQFSFLVFADTKNTSFSAMKYIKKSIEISKPKYFIKFVIIVFLYFLILLPFRSIDTILESNIEDMSNTYNYRNDLFIDLTESDREYLEFLALDYEQYEDSELLEKIRTQYTMRILHFFVSYIFFWWLILLIVSSFYRRILLKK